MSGENRTVKLPSTWAEADLDGMVDTVALWIDRVAALLTSEAGHLYLRRDISERLRQGTIETLKVVAAADEGHQDADLALRELGAEMLDRGEMPNATLRSYLVRALVTAPVSNSEGRDLADNWVRNIGISILVEMTMNFWHLKLSRSHATKPSKGFRPSASHVVAVALTKRGHPIGEHHVARIHREHTKLAARLSASIRLE